MNVKTRVAIATAATLLSLSWPLTAERYIVPIYARGVKGADGGEWYSKVVLTNTQKLPVTATVSEIFPLVASSCSGCESVVPTVQPGQSQLVRQVADGFDLLRFGSFVIETDRPIMIQGAIHHYNYEGGGIQHIDIIEGWIPPGAVAWIPDVDIQYFGRMNVFFINPNPFPILASYSMGSSGQEIQLPPRSTTLHPFPYPHCGNAPCPPPQFFIPPLGYRLEISADGEFYAFMSVIYEGGDAVFRGAVFQQE